MHFWQICYSSLVTIVENDTIIAVHFRTLTRGCKTFMSSSTINLLVTVKRWLILEWTLTCIHIYIYIYMGVYISTCSTTIYFIVRYNRNKFSRISGWHHNVQYISYYLMRFSCRPPSWHDNNFNTDGRIFCMTMPSLNERHFTKVNIFSCESQK